MKHKFKTIKDMEERIKPPWYRHHWLPWGWPKFEPKEGDSIEVEGYASKGDGGSMEYTVVPANTGEDDGGGYIELTPYQCAPIWSERVDLLSTEEGHEYWENAIDKELDK